jgi:hypothetical protein
MKFYYLSLQTIFIGFEDILITVACFVNPTEQYQKTVWNKTNNIKTVIQKI